MKLRALKLRPQQTPHMGTEVVALGFPLGQNLLKISKGVVAGNQEVEGNICIQSTAPISPGNSGGPLLAGDPTEGEDEVVGVNFAKATGSAENINFVIPAWRVQQVIRRHQYDLNKAKAKAAAGNKDKDAGETRIPIKIAMPQITVVEGSEAIYRMVPKCARNTGVLITKVDPRSFLQRAVPPVAENSLLVSVNGVALDEFGEGRNPAYAEDQVNYPNLFYMRENLFGDVKFETCNAAGDVVAHLASLDNVEELSDRGIVRVDEPTYEHNKTRYEIFGDVSVMQLTVNHIDSLIAATQNPGPARWLHPDLVTTPRLVVNYVRGGSYGADVLAAGSIITKINGVPVFTLEDFRENFFPGGEKKKKHVVKEVETLETYKPQAQLLQVAGEEESASSDGDADDEDLIWTLETDLGKLYAVLFKKTLRQQLLAGQAGESYMLSDTVLSAGVTLGWVKAQPALLNESPSAKSKTKSFFQDDAVSSSKTGKSDSDAATATAARSGPLLVEKVAAGRGGYRISQRTDEVVDHLEM